jgi:hypothetical protein
MLLFKRRCRDAGLNRVLAPEGEIFSLRKTFPGFRPAGLPYWLFKFASGEFVLRLGNCSCVAKPQGCGGRDCSRQSCGISSIPGGQCRKRIRPWKACSRATQEQLPRSGFLPTSCMTHRDVGNADIAGATICPCSRKESIQRKGGPLPLRSSAPRFHRGLPEGPPWPFGNAQPPCRAPCGQDHSTPPCASPYGAAHANRLSCRFVPAKALVLGAANGTSPCHGKFLLRNR